MSLPILCVQKYGPRKEEFFLAIAWKENDTEVSLTIYPNNNIDDSADIVLLTAEHPSLIDDGPYFLFEQEIHRTMEKNVRLSTDTDPKLDDLLLVVEAERRFGLALEVRLQDLKDRWRAICLLVNPT